MEASDQRWFRDQVNALAVNFRQEAGTPLFQALWIGLEDISRENVAAAIKRAMRECEYMPVVAKLRELAGQKKRPPEPGYLRPVEGELERIETCQFHVKTPGVTAPSPVSWCRKCKRLRIAAERGGAPSRLDDMLHTFGLLPPLEKEGQK